MAKKWTREEFAAYVGKLEPQARRDPKGYRLKVALFAALGYGFIILLLLFSIAALVLMVVGFINHMLLNAAGIKIFILLCGFVFVTLSSLWVRFPKPDPGIPLSEADAPELFRRVFHIADRLDAPRPAHFRLVPELNAAVIQHPRLGILGFSENYLIVGLPLLLALSPAQFDSVIAHELGHLRGGHGRFGAWVYRVNETWARLVEGGGSVTKQFFQWFAPLFAAYSFVLRRGEEYEADRTAAMVATPRIAADALCALPVIDSTLDSRVWKPLSDSVRTANNPPVSLFVPMRDALRTPFTEDLNHEKSLQLALREETGFADTHPSLRDRLKALGQEPRLPEPVMVCAADVLLGANLPRLSGILDAMWLQEVTPIWEKRHQTAKEETAQLEAFTQRIANGETLPPNERLHHAVLVEAYQNEDAALPLYNHLFEIPEVSAQAYFAVGRIELERDNPEGIAYLEEAVRHDSTATNAMNGLIYAYHQRQGSEEAAHEIMKRAVRHADLEDDAAEERSHINGNFIPQTLPADKIAKIQEIVAQNANIREVHLVQKQLYHFPERPLYIVGYRRHRKMFQMENAARFKATTDALIRQFQEAQIFSDDFFVVPLYGETRAVEKRIKKVAGSQIYQEEK